MTISDPRVQRQPLSRQERIRSNLVESPASTGLRIGTSYYDADASSFDDVHRPEVADLMAATTPMLPSGDLRGVSGS
jgi:hypothetical protein